MKLQPDTYALNFRTETVNGEPLQLTDFRGKKIFLAFLRNTQCPLCSLYVYKLLKITDILAAHNMETFLFYESDKRMFKYSAFFQDAVLKENKVKVIADPTRHIYELYGAELSAMKASMPILEAAGRMPEIQEALDLGFLAGQDAGTNADAIPADFLIDENLIIRKVFYGKDGGDHLSLKEVEAFARQGVALPY